MSDPIDPADVARSYVPPGSLWSLMRNRDITTGVGKLLPQDLGAVTDRPAISLQWELLAGWPVPHGTVADEAAMLALHTFGASAATTPLPRYVAPGDSVLRADDPGWRWYCIANHGQDLTDWERRPLAGALSGLAVNGHTHPMVDVGGLSTALAEQQSALDEQQEEIGTLADRQLSDSGEGVSLIGSPPFGMRKLIAGAGVAIALVGGAIEISAEGGGAGAGATPGDAMSDFSGLATGEIVTDDSGGGWAAPATPYIVDHPQASDDYAGITVGEITSYSGGTGWAGPLTTYTP